MIIKGALQFAITAMSVLSLSVSGRSTAHGAARLSLKETRMYFVQAAGPQERKRHKGNGAG